MPDTHAETGWHWVRSAGMQMPHLALLFVTASDIQGGWDESDVDTPPASTTIIRAAESYEIPGQQGDVAPELVAALARIDELEAALTEAEYIMRVLDGKKTISPSNAYPLQRAWKAAVKALGPTQETAK